jgi:hypothetical protein
MVYSEVVLEMAVSARGAEHVAKYLPVASAASYTEPLQTPSATTNSCHRPKTQENR